jgi:MFS family permease
LPKQAFNAKLQGNGTQFAFLATVSGNAGGGIMPVLNRWWIAVAGVFLQMALGSAYAWSVFRIPLSKEFGWTISQVTSTFLISWFFLGVAAFIGGLWMKRRHPRVVAMTAGLLWGGGVYLASFSAHRLWWLYLTYGVIGGVGLGMGYVVPITVLVKWFPDRRGFITGLAVAGFGTGALFSAPAAGWLIRHVGLMPTFAYLGGAYGVIAIVSASFMQFPSEGWMPEGWTPTAKHLSQRSDDLTSRKIAFFLMYLVEVILFWTYHSIDSLPLLAVATFVVAMCYGGAYGITPAFAADYFGPRDVGSIFGLMMLPWAFAAAAGPYLFAYLRQVNGDYTQALYVIAGIMTCALILPALIHPPQGRKRGDEHPTGAAIEAEAEAISPE